MYALLSSKYTRWCGRIRQSFTTQLRVKLQLCHSLHFEWSRIEFWSLSPSWIIASDGQLLSLVLSPCRINKNDMWREQKSILVPIAAIAETRDKLHRGICAIKSIATFYFRVASYIFSSCDCLTSATCLTCLSLVYCLLAVD